MTLSAVNDEEARRMAEVFKDEFRRLMERTAHQQQDIIIVSGLMGLLLTNHQGIGSFDFQNENRAISQTIP
jgi:hypothetical protein